ncbi:hypothetical protein [Actinomadura formosensis]|uniref:phage tail tube protein n=1 Tax=Actinomadura formosensis TaxID=60706 RepID=UPI003D9419E1
MSATPITASSRYINPGVTKIVFATAVANKSAPTRGEINAGTDVTREVQNADGWVTESKNVDTPDLDSEFTGKIPGRTSAEDSSFAFYADEAGADARQLLPRGTSGFVMIFDGGDVPGRKMRIFPVRVSSVGMPIDIEGGDAAVVNIAFAITSVPAENVAVPA